MIPPQSVRPNASWWWTLGLLALLATRLPAFVEPAGSDQNIYVYVGERILHGEVPYVDAWDQKPPAIFFVYAALRQLWPLQSIVAFADLGAAALLAGSLILLGRQTLGARVGQGAAGLALLFGHPSLSRLSGVYLRGQCETFIAPAITIALVLVARRERGRSSLALAGASLGIAFWLKYNALTYALPLALAVSLWPHTNSERRPLADLLWVATGFAIVSGVMLGYFAAHGALDALRLATVDYNLRYSTETYAGGPLSVLTYLVTMPIDRIRADMLWFLGAIGAAALVFVGRRRQRHLTIVAVGWLAATVLSIAINGARDLPQYFVQAVPALAFSGAAGLALAWREGRAWRVAAVAVLALGVWRVGVESPSIGGFRWGGVPQLVDNIGFDLRFVTGRVDRATYLERFKGAQKYDAAAIDHLTEYVRTATEPDDRILVFGFAPGVYVNSGRLSASRFFWSRPVILEFAADRPGYGSRGLVRDLEAHPPTVVALQKKDWEPTERNSQEFFQSTPVLRDWLNARFTLVEDTPVFTIWRRTS